MRSYLGIFSHGSYQFSRVHGERSFSILHGCKNFRVLFACMSEGQRHHRFTVLTRSLTMENLCYPQTLSCSVGKHWSGAPCAPGDPSYTVSGHSWILLVSPTSYYSCCGSEQRTKLMGEQSEWDLRRQNTVLLFSFHSLCSCFIFLFPPPFLRYDWPIKSIHIFRVQCDVSIYCTLYTLWNDSSSVCN